MADVPWPDVRQVRECSHDSDNHHHHVADTDGDKAAMSVIDSRTSQAMAPFLAQHVPAQYNHVGAAPQEQVLPEKTANTTFCNRHRPDLKCRRQANEPTMEQLQTALGQLSQSDQQAISHVWALFSAAPSKHRNLMLRGILTQCCFPQLSLLAVEVRELVKIDFLSALPAELSYKILCHLDTASLCRTAQVSRRWATLANDDLVWHRMCEQHIDRKCKHCGIGLPLLDKRRLRTERIQDILRERRSIEISGEQTSLLSADPAEPSYTADATQRTLQDLHLPSHSGSAKRPLSSGAGGAGTVIDDAAPGPNKRVKGRPWKDVYRDRFRVGRNWAQGKCSVNIFKEHTNGVMCLQFDETHLITGSYDAMIKVWDLKTKKCIRTLRGHTSGVRCLQFDSRTLMSGSLDGTMRVWDWRTGATTKVLNAHRGGVISLHYTKKLIVTGSTDRTIKVFDMRASPNSTPITYRLRGHTDWVNSVKIDETSLTLFSASDDFTVRLWDLETRECIRIFEGHVGQIQQVLLMPAEFEPAQDGPTDMDRASSGSSTLVPAQSSHRQQQSELRTHSSCTVPPLWQTTATRAAPPRYMVTCALDNTIRLWDVHATAKMYASPTPLPQNNPQEGGHRHFYPTVFQHVRTFFGHVEGVWAMAVDQLRLVSGSEDKTVKIWDPRTGKCERTWTGHAGPVTCIGLSDSRLVSGSEDNEIRMLTFSEEDGSVMEQNSVPDTSDPLHGPGSVFLGSLSR